jgi:ABC transporter substrate binding protein
MPTEVLMRVIGLAVVLTLGLTLAPLVAEAQQAQKIHRIGYVWSGTAGSDPVEVEGLRQGLRELGYIENQNIVIDYRYAEGHVDRLPRLIAELANLKVALLLTAGTLVTAVAKRGAGETPIVSVSGDPVGSGLVQSLSRPGGTITGLSFGHGTNFSGKFGAYQAGSTDGHACGRHLEFGQPGERGRRKRDGGLGAASSSPALVARRAEPGGH